MRTTLLSGSIEPGQVPRIFLSLQTSAMTGKLRLQRDGIARDFCLRGGMLVWADSSSVTETLEWLLFAAGILSEERHAVVRAEVSRGGRRGRSLVEEGRIAPATVCEWTERRARYLASDVVAWRSGECEFAEGVAPPPGAIEVRVLPAEIVVLALREGAAYAASILPEDPDLVPEPAPAGSPDLVPADRILTHERYVGTLVDGRRKVSEICELSEIGEGETLKALALLIAAGRVNAATTVAGALVAAAEAPEPAGDQAIAPPADLPAGETTAELRVIVRTYNELYASVYAHLIKEVGPIADQYLERHLREVRDLHAMVLGRVTPGRGASLAEDAVIRSMNLMKDQNRRDLLIGALHDYLRAMVTAVRRILGSEHEARVLRRLQEQRCAKI
ncbi:MAG TPA: DUF4388 domain-containing protein [Candidatus Polarisedimenticolia bacterium]